MAVSKAEFAWRAWFLGEGEFKGDPRNYARRPQTGAPARIPLAWWKRLEAFLAARNDHTEPNPRPPAPDGQVSPHFTVREFDCHDGRKVPAIAIPALKRLAVAYLEPMRATFGPCHILSGYRPKDYNARIGGAKFSQHIYELTPEAVAADLVFRIGTPAAWAALADQLGAGGLGLYESFVHVDNRPNRARWTG